MRPKVNELFVFGARAQRSRPSSPVVTAVLVLWTGWAMVEGHVFVAKEMRAGAYPPTDGTGWVGEVFLDLPNFDLPHWLRFTACLLGPQSESTADCYAGRLDTDADVDLRDVARFQINAFNNHLLHAERMTEGRAPDFTFRTPWIDFPSGPQDSDLDRNFRTIGDFLNDYVDEVSDPSKLAAPFGSFLLRFTGYVKIRLADEVRIRDLIALPVWIDFGTMGYDGYRCDVGETAYRVPNVKYTGQPFFNFGPSVEVLGLFPVEITYFNSYDPGERFGNGRAGVEVYSWHGGGLPWPAGWNMVHPEFGPATLAPPWVIYQADAVKPAVKGDFDADYDIDLRDVQWFQICGDPNYFLLPAGCDAFDFGGDGRVRLNDFAAFGQVLKGPDVPSDSIDAP